MDYQNENIIIFDGVCNLCNGLVRFVIKNDRKGTIRFAPLQSDFGRHLQSAINTGKRNSDTVVYSRKGINFFRSDAVLYILKDLGGPWRILYGLRIIPRFLRDYIYNVVAANRYRVFGKRDTCMIPGPEIKERFLQQ
jgi:predicted DCC family thiol-disulfide oxidoreductase YuxK